MEERSATCERNERVNKAPDYLPTSMRRSRNGDRHQVGIRACPRSSNTVDIGAFGRITPREAAAAALIRSKLPPGEHLVLVPKHQLFRDQGF